MHKSKGGAHVDACRHNDRHLVTYDEDLTWFDVILSPLHDAKPTRDVGGYVYEYASIGSSKELH